MITGQFVTIDYIIEELNRKPLPGMSYNPEELNEWAWQALTFIGTKIQNIEASKILEVKNGRALLPNNIQEFGNIIEYTSGYSMDELPLEADFTDMSYKLNNGYVYTSFSEGVIQVNYFAFPTDEGKVLIPDNLYFIKAVESYIRMQLGERLFWMNKILGNQLQMLKNEWSYYAMGSRNDTKMMRTDRLYNFRKNNLKALPNFNRRNYYQSDNSIVVNKTII